MTDDSIDTSLFNNGIIFNQNPVDGELDYYWDNETEICSPSLMPDNNFTINEFSGDSTYLEEKCFQNMANLLNKQNHHHHVAQNELQSSKNPNDIDVDMDDVLLDDMVKEMTDALTINNQEFKENEETLNIQDFEDFEDFEEPEEPKEPEDPPSPMSPRDPEREGPVLSEEEEDTEEGGIHRLEHDPKFQDEAGLMYGDDSRGKIWPDDEGMDPMENQ